MRVLPTFIIAWQNTTVLDVCCFDMLESSYHLCAFLVFRYCLKAYISELSQLHFRLAGTAHELDTAVHVINYVNCTLQSERTASPLLRVSTPNFPHLQVQQDSVPARCPTSQRHWWAQQKILLVICVVNNQGRHLLTPSYNLRRGTVVEDPTASEKRQCPWYLCLLV